MAYQLNIDGSQIAFYGAVLATYAAVVSTSLFVWDIVKWKKSGARLKGVYTAPVIFMGNGYDGRNEEFISVAVTNVGGAATVITNLSFTNWESKWHKRLRFLKKYRNRAKHFVIADPTIGGKTGYKLPFTLDPGHQWRGFGDFESIREILAEGQTYFIVSHTRSEKGLVLKAKKPTAKKESSAEKSATKPS